MCWELFISFARIGLFTFGGGYAMLPMLEREVVQKKAWVSMEELMDYYAIGQCTPGVIAVNTATFIGYKKKKLLGAVSATLGVIFPSVLLITLIAGFLQSFAHVAWIAHAFAGIRIVVCALVFHTVWKLFQRNVKGTFPVVIFLLAYIAVGFVKLSPLWIVLAGMILSFARGEKNA